MKYILLILLSTFSLSCQLTFKKKKPADPEKPITKEITIPKKWGLFISGAGANTFASLPVIEVLKRHNISFDWIAGTGWGAWIAAIYAQNQSVDELKWQTFKLKEQGVFGTKWFDNKQKRVSSLQKLTKQVINGPAQAEFFCPALDKKNQQILWLSPPPAKNIFNCLNKIPPLFFSFPKTRGIGSLFSVSESISYMKNEKQIDYIIWINPNIFLKKESIVFSIFWKELIANLRNFKKKISPDILVINIQTKLTSLYDFEKINQIIKTSVPTKQQEKIYNFQKQAKEKQQ